MERKSQAREDWRRGSLAALRLTFRRGAEDLQRDEEAAKARGDGESFHCAKNAQWCRSLTARDDHFTRVKWQRNGLSLLRSK